MHWYNRDISDGAAERAEEIRKVKEAEAEALSAALYVLLYYNCLTVTNLLYRGFAPSAKPAAAGPASGANATLSSVPSKMENEEPKASEKEEKRRKKAERKEEKKAKKEAKRAGRVAGRYESDDGERSRRRDPSRSRSPRRHQSSKEPEVDHMHASRRHRSRSMTPPIRDKHTSSHRMREHDVVERERDGERDRRRWASSSRDRPAHRSRRD